MFRTIDQIETVMEQAPFKPSRADPRVKRYVVFLAHKPKSPPAFPLVCEKDALEAVAMGDLEVFVVSRRKRSGFYGFPNTFVERALGVSSTSRNWSTVTRLVEFAGRKP